MEPDKKKRVFKENIKEEISKVQLPINDFSDETILFKLNKSNLEYMIKIKAQEINWEKEFENYMKK
jgi:hypothetical protein